MKKKWTILNDVKKNKKVSPRLKKIIGSVKLKKDFDEGKELQSYLEKKHLS